MCDPDRALCLQERAAPDTLALSIMTTSGMSTSEHTYSTTLPQRRCSYAQRQLITHIFKAGDQVAICAYEDIRRRRAYGECLDDQLKVWYVGRSYATAVQTIRATFHICFATNNHEWTALPPELTVRRGELCRRMTRNRWPTSFRRCSHKYLPCPVFPSDATCNLDDCIHTLPPRTPSLCTSAAATQNTS